MFLDILHVLIYVLSFDLTVDVVLHLSELLDHRNLFYYTDTTSPLNIDHSIVLSFFAYNFEFAKKVVQLVGVPIFSFNSSMFFRSMIIVCSRFFP